MANPFIEHLRAVWAGLGDVPVAAFSSDVPRAVAAAGSRLCPPGWVGAVVIDGSALITTPSEESAKHVSRALARLRGEQVTDPGVVSALLPVADVLGPAWLSYPNPAGPPRLHPTGHAQRLVADHDDLLQLQRAVSADDLEESGLQEITSDAFVVREDGVVTSAAVYRRWPHQVAHLCVLTAASARGRGLAAIAAGAAVSDAVGRGLLPQWRARPAASRRVAAQLGFQQLGCQLSIRLQEPVP